MAALESVAVQLQKWRTYRGMSVSALARAAGVSKSTVSELERGKGNPALDTLWALASALNIPFGFLFADHNGQAAVRVVREADTPIVAEDLSFISRLMGGWQVNGQIEIYLLTIAKDRRRQSDSHGIGVIEHAVVMAGTATIGVGLEFTVLEPGDMLTFSADQPHSYEATGGQARVLSIHEYPRGRPGVLPHP
jgi:transcriptional regulator with XRE-family HTH domain